MDLLTILEFLTLFSLINTEHTNHRYDLSKRLKFDGIKKEINHKRYLDLVRYTQNDYTQEKVINHNDIIGTIPSNFFKNFDHDSDETVDETYDSVPSESDINIVQVDPQDVTVGESVETAQILPYENQNDYFPTEKRVKIHVFRGPNMRYWIQGKHGKKAKYYSNWGYIIKQPADNFIPQESFIF